MLAFGSAVAVSAFVAVLGWALGIAPRLAVIETKHTDLRELLATQLDDVKERLERIERLILNGKH
jgi:hypothetical protein